MGSVNILFLDKISEYFQYIINTETSSFITFHRRERQGSTFFTSHRLSTIYLVSSFQFLQGFIVCPDISSFYRVLQFAPIYLVSTGFHSLFTIYLVSTGFHSLPRYIYLVSTGFHSLPRYIQFLQGFIVCSRYIQFLQGFIIYPDISSFYRVSQFVPIYIVSTGFHSLQRYIQFLQGFIV